MKIRKILFSIVFILVGIIAVFLYSYVQNQIEYNFYVKWEEADYFNNTNSIHWGHMPLRYEIYNCPPYEEERILKAFEILEYHTNLLFIELDDFDDKYGYNPYVEEDLGFYCENISHFITEWNGKSLGMSHNAGFKDNMILLSNSEITFFYIEDFYFMMRCESYPTIELHEILHSLGFYHSEKEGSIMQEAIKMCAKISQDEISIINEIYGLEDI